MTPEALSRTVEPAPVVPVVEPVHTLDEAEARRIDFLWCGGMVLGLGLLFAVLSIFRGVGIPVVLALVLAFALNPLVNWLSLRPGWNRTTGTAAVFVSLLLAMVGFVLYITPVFVSEASKFPDFFTRASTQIFPFFESRFHISVPEFFRQRTAELGTETASLLKDAVPTLAAGLAIFAGNTARVLATLLGLLVVPVLGFFFLMDFPQLIARARSLIPRRAERHVVLRFVEVDRVLSGFIRGQLTVGAILSCLYITGLSFAGVDLAIVIGLISGFGNMVPYMGTAIGLVLSLLGVALSWQGPWQLLAVGATFLVAQGAEALVLGPRIVGGKVGLPPVAVIIAVLAFGEVFGFVGILLAVPSTAVLKVVLRVVLQRYRKTQLYLGEAPPA